MYMDSISFLNISWTTFLFSFRVGVNTPKSIVSSTGRIVCLWTLWALEIAFLLAYSSPRLIISLTLGQRIAYWMVFAFEPYFLRTSMTSSASSLGLLGSFSFKQIRQLRYFLISPMTTTWDTMDNALTISFSIRTGGMFSPPAVTISSFILPVIYKMPLESILPSSPEWTKPFRSIALQVSSSFLK